MSPRLTPAVKAIIIVTTGFYVVELIPQLFEYYIIPYLALWPQRVLYEGTVWQVFSYMLVHDIAPLHVVLNMMTLWFIGGAVEDAWGTRRFTSYYILCGVGGGISAVLLFQPFPIIGASGAIFGVMVAFAMLFPDTMMLFPPMRVVNFVLLLLAIDLAMMLGQTGGGVAVVAHLGGALTGFLYVKFSWRLGEWWKRTFINAPPRRFSGPTPITSRRATRKQARVSRGAGAGGGRAATVVTLPGGRGAADATADEIAIQRRADEILDKISREGMGSLSREEREILNRHSQILKSREGDIVRLDDYRP